MSTVEISGASTDNGSTLYQKVLTASDLNGNARLMFGRGIAETTILPLFSVDDIAAASTVCGTLFYVEDKDGGENTSKKWCLKQWPSTKNFVLNNGWREYARSCNADIGDTVRIFHSPTHTTFSVEITSPEGARRRPPVHTDTVRRGSGLATVQSKKRARPDDTMSSGNAKRPGREGCISYPASDVGRISYGNSTGVTCMVPKMNAQRMEIDLELRLGIPGLECGGVRTEPAASSSFCRDGDGKQFRSLRYLGDYRDLNLCL